MRNRILSALLALTVMFTALCAPAMATSVGIDYTTAEKLYRQLSTGSGFSGTLTLEITAKDGHLGEVITTQKPVTVDVDYIYVPQTDTALAEHRADLTLRDGETALSAAHVQMLGDRLAFQADLVGDDWYALGGVEAAAESVSAQDATLSGLLTMALPLLSVSPTSRQSETLEALLDSYLTRIDLWIEGFRESTEMGKLEDGTTTMHVNYQITPTAIKAQVKQLVFDLVNDAEMLALLQTLAPESAQELLDPALIDYYFAAIDRLSIEEDMTIERTVSMKGDTLALHITLPMYDAEGGAFTLRYDRTQGEGDLPDDNLITLESESRTTALSYVEYSSMTNVTVRQGTFTSVPHTSFDVTEEAEPPVALGVAFTLSLSEQEGRDEQARDTHDVTVEVSLAPAEVESDVAPLTFPATDITLAAHFASQTLQNAATEMDATLTVGGEEWANEIKLNLAGKSRKKWTPEALPMEPIEWASLTQSEVNAMVPAITARGLMTVLTFFNLPMDSAEATEVPAESEAPAPSPAT